MIDKITIELNYSNFPAKSVEFSSCVSRTWSSIHYIVSKLSQVEWRCDKNLKRSSDWRNSRNYWKCEIVILLISTTISMEPCSSYGGVWPHRDTISSSKSWFPIVIPNQNTCSIVVTQELVELVSSWVQHERSSLEW